ncbi:unnamed protein product, partial [Oppiella nova]
MSAPLSPNGSTTSSVISSEDSSSNISGYTGPGVRHTQHYSLPSPQLASTSQTNQLVANHLNNRQIKVCRVCGDRAKSYHFGGISCDSCKAFFRRSVQNDAFRNFHCPYDRHCDITINSRKSCQFCRFNKCLSIGMEKSWVMTEEERMQMLKNRIEKRKLDESDGMCAPPEAKQHINNYSPNTSNDRKYDTITKYEPNITEINTYLTKDEVKLIENIMNQIRKCSQEISFTISGADTSASTDQRAPIDILQIFFTAIQQFALFVHSFVSLAAIPTQDKQVLLKGGVLELCFLRGAFSYDMRGKHWRYDEQRPAGVIYSDDLQVMLSKDLLEKHMQFIKTIKRLRMDEPTYILLSLVILLTPDREGLTSAQLVQREQEKYLLLLKAYMSWRYGPRVSALLYPKLLLKLADLRELADAHTDYALLLGHRELQQIQHKLTALNIGASNRVDSPTTDPLLCDTPVSARAAPPMTGQSPPAEEQRPAGVIYSDDLQVMLSKDLLEKHMQFIKTIKRLRMDEPTYILLSLVILLTPDREGLTSAQLVQREQEKYLLLLKAYMSWRYGPRVSALLYPKLLLKLADLRELADAHTDYALLLGHRELQQIQHKLTALNIGASNRVDSPTTDPLLCDNGQSRSRRGGYWPVSGGRLTCYPLRRWYQSISATTRAIASHDYTTVKTFLDDTKSDTTQLIANEYKEVSEAENSPVSERAYLSFDTNSVDSSKTLTASHNPTNNECNESVDNNTTNDDMIGNNTSAKSDTILDAKCEARSATTGGRQTPTSPQTSPEPRMSHRSGHNFFTLPRLLSGRRKRSKRKSIVMSTESSVVTSSIREEQSPETESIGHVSAHTTATTNYGSDGRPESPIYVKESFFMRLMRHLASPVHGGGGGGGRPGVHSNRNSY